MSVLRSVVVLILLILLMGSGASAQNWCPPLRFASVESFKARLMEMAEAGRRGGLSLVSTALAPTPSPGCPQVPLDTDLNVLMDDLVRWSVGLGDRGLQASIIFGIKLALGRDREEPRPTIHVVHDVFDPAGGPIREELARQPERIRHPGARCVVERGWAACQGGG